MILFKKLVKVIEEFLKSHYLKSYGLKKNKLLNAEGNEEADAYGQEKAPEDEQEYYYEESKADGEEEEEYYYDEEVPQGEESKVSPSATQIDTRDKNIKIITQDVE